MYRTVPASEPEPNSVPCGPRSTSTRPTSNRSRSGVNSDSEITDSSRYAPTSSFTPGWSREIWPEDAPRSEEHTSELQSRPHLVCRLLLEKKKKNQHNHCE